MPDRVSFHERAGMSLLFAAVTALAIGGTAGAVTLQWRTFVVGAVSGAQIGLLYGALVYRRQPAQERKYEAVTYTVNAVAPVGKAGVASEFPVSSEKMRAMAKRLVNGDSFTEAVLCGRWGVFTRTEFVQVRDVMRRAGWVAPRGASPKVGFEITLAGWHRIRDLADE